MNVHTIEMAAAGDRSGESAQPRHRHADAGRDRRGDDSRQQTRARGRAARKDAHRARCRARGRGGAERRTADLRRRRHERPAWRARGGRAAADVRHRPGHGAGDHGRRARPRFIERKKGSKTITTRASARCAASGPTRKDVVDRHFGERHHAVRARRGHAARAAAKAPHHRRHLRSAIGAERSRRCGHCPRAWGPRSSPARRG